MFDGNVKMILSENEHGDKGKLSWYAIGNTKESLNKQTVGWNFGSM